MTIKRLAMGCGAILVLVGAWFLIPSRAAHHESPPAEQQQAKTIYHCPMHPTYTSDKPGTCPICGMTLVPMEEHQHETEDVPTSAVPSRATIQLTDHQRQLIGVTTTKVVQKTLVRAIRTVGEVAYDPTLATTPGKAWINVTLYELDVGSVSVGHDVRVSLPDRPDSTFVGTIAAVSPLIDRATRTLRARAEVADPEGILKPLRFVDIFIHIPLGEGLSVPASAVLESGETAYVFVDHGEGQLEPRRITMGLRLGEETQVLAGLEAGEVVVASANFLIDAESQLRAATERLGAEKASGGHVH